jgi:L-amino acid N-acyltransferase YncA
VAEDWQVRDATVEDGAVCAELYAPYVRDTVVSFELEPPTAAEMAVRIAAALARYAWVVLGDGGRVVGYAYGAPFNPRAAYDCRRR